MGILNIVNCHFSHILMHTFKEILIQCPQVLRNLTINLKFIWKNKMKKIRFLKKNNNKVHLHYQILK